MPIVIDQMESTVDPVDVNAGAAADSGHKPASKPEADLASDLRRLTLRQARLRAD